MVLHENDKVDNQVLCLQEVFAVSIIAMPKWTRILDHTVDREHEQLNKKLCTAKISK